MVCLPPWPGTDHAWLTFLLVASAFHQPITRDICAPLKFTASENHSRELMPIGPE